MVEKSIGCNVDRDEAILNYHMANDAHLTEEDMMTRLYFDFYIIQRNILDIADKLMRGLTNYKLDGCMYTIYHELSNLYYLSTLYDDYESYDKYDYELEDEVLKNNLVKVDIKFNNYATIGSLFAIYYFKLNDETKEWLLKKGDVLNFNGLEDFALLKDDTLLYATCTHEGYK